MLRIRVRIRIRQTKRPDTDSDQYKLQAFIKVISAEILFMKPQVKYFEHLFTTKKKIRKNQFKRLGSHLSNLEPQHCRPVIYIFFYLRQTDQCYS
jgi:hypothetical protein